MQKTEEDKNYELLTDIFRVTMHTIEEKFGKDESENEWDYFWDELRNPILNLIEERIESD